MGAVVHTYHGGHVGARAQGCASWRDAIAGNPQPLGQDWSGHAEPACEAALAVGPKIAGGVAVTPCKVPTRARPCRPSEEHALQGTKVRNLDTKR